MKYMLTYTLRISEDLMEQLREVAEYNSRSVNKEIEFLIKQHVEAFQKEHKSEKSQNKENVKDKLGGLR